METKQQREEEETYGFICCFFFCQMLVLLMLVDLVIAVPALGKWIPADAFYWMMFYLVIFTLMRCVKLGIRTHCPTNCDQVTHVV